MNNFKKSNRIFFCLSEIPYDGDKMPSKSIHQKFPKIFKNFKVLNFFKEFWFFS